MYYSSVELLAPAKDVACGIAAVEHGADALYIGGPSFSARAAAGNSLADIERLVRFAHIFHVRVYVALNTLLNDAELQQAIAMAWQLYDVGVDALIIQDFGLFRAELPPLELHASTQMHNTTPGKVRLLQQLGAAQVVLARELSLAEIAEIAQKTTVRLEAFVHGALCVSYSGRCYISEVMAQRSGNRGECAQFCRHRYTLEDARGRVIEKDRYLLSLQDLCQLQNLEEMLDAGIRSFKIEGRLKDASYVKNVTALYRQRLDRILADRADLCRASSGTAEPRFTPDAVKTFSRGGTDYFLHGRSPRMASLDTPKATGEYVGRVIRMRGDAVELETSAELHNGDGFCFFDAEGELIGFRANRVEGEVVFPARGRCPEVGTPLFRNYDKAFFQQLEKSTGCRKIAVSLHLTETVAGLQLSLHDEDGCRSEAAAAIVPQPARNAAGTIAALSKQLMRSGGTHFSVQNLQVDVDSHHYYPLPVIKELRRRILEKHLETRISGMRARYPLLTPQFLCRRLQEYAEQLQPEPSDFPNITNSKAKELLKKLMGGAEEVSSHTENLMTCRYCIRAELGMCLKKDGGHDGFAEPFLLRDNVGIYQLVFDCKNCRMLVRLSSG